jgi:hypothetical protein
MAAYSKPKSSPFSIPIRNVYGQFSPPAALDKSRYKADIILVWHLSDFVCGENILVLPDLLYGLGNTASGHLPLTLS